MLDFFVLGSSLGFFLYGAKTFVDDRRLRRTIEELDRSKNFDMDYLPGLDGVPREKPICLRGMFDGPQESACFDREEKIALNRISSFSKPPAHLLEDQEGDNYVVSVPKRLVDKAAGYYLLNEKNEGILVDFSRQPETLLHNTFTLKPPAEVKTRSQLLAFLQTQSSSFRQKLDSPQNLRGEDFFEMGLSAGQHYNFVGTVSKYDGSIPNPRNASLMMKTNIVTGEMKENLMRHIDNKIMLNTKKSRLIIGFTLAAWLGTVVYKRTVMPAIEEYRHQTVINEQKKRGRSN